MLNGFNGAWLVYIVVMVGLMALLMDALKASVRLHRKNKYRYWWACKKLRLAQAITFGLVLGLGLNILALSVVMTRGC